MKKLTKLPLKFGKVTGWFDCSHNQLTSLEGCPTSVGGNFWCTNNQLTSLKGGPTIVNGHFGCGGNPFSEEIMDPKAYLKQLNRDKLLDELLGD
jgi:hypothetical protein